MKARIYVDTSVFSALLDERVPERRILTKDFWNRRAQYDLGVSEVCREELRNVADSVLREKLLSLLDQVAIIPITDEMQALANRYLTEGAFSSAMFNDALHVAAAVLSRYELLVSWNFRHLVNRRRRAKVNAVNIDLGLPPIEILAPPEV